MGSIKVTVKDMKGLQKELKKMREAPQKVIDSTLSEVKSRGPGWIASGVVEMYGPKSGKSKLKSEILEEKVGELNITGSTIKDIAFQYSGRRLTPVHFGMKPTEPAKNRGGYTLKAEITQGKKSTIGKTKKLTKKQLKNIGRNFTHQSTQNSPASPWQLQPTGAKSADKTQYIPFQRRVQPGDPMYVFRTVSLPQMVTEGKDGPMHPLIAEKFNTQLDKRFEHYVKRYMEK